MQLRSSSPHDTTIHFDTVDLSAHTSNSQTLSFAIHAAILAALLLLATSPKTHEFIRSIPLGRGEKIPAYIPPAETSQFGRPSLGQNAGGGEHELLPTTAGRFAPHSSMPLVPPRKIINDSPELPEPPAAFDPNAPSAVPVITDLGLPWMKDKNGSAGPGGPHGFGAGKGTSMGDGEGDDGEGVGSDGGAYANIASPVACVYCPEPPYTDEARQNKLQGKMLLKVLVGEDGRAKKVRVVRPLGMGLDESAERAVYSWRFAPARDAAKHAVASWVTIETRFQLF
ncbi:MAG TPA: energy transducer TonB [Candidatus Saccharimonadales bacterium]|nr:energy transducer TonB [Candidatus Saccharimonadales bacterium]